MKRTFLQILILLASLLITKCKTERKTESESTGETVRKTATELQNENTFETRILDLRNVGEKFNNQYGIEKFGMLKNNDSIYSFVFKLDNRTTEKTVEAYSLGIRIFDQELPETLNLSFHPEVSKIEGRNYLILGHKIRGANYYDSLDVYIYKRKDWKSSGRLGEIKIKDVLFK